MLALKTSTYSAMDKHEVRPRYLVASIDSEWRYTRQFSDRQLCKESYRVKGSECFRVRGEFCSSGPCTTEDRTADLHIYQRHFPLDTPRQHDQSIPSVIGDIGMCSSSPP